MSDVGLLGSVYEQIRVFSDQIDHLLVDMKGKNEDARKQSRQQLNVLLERLVDKSTKDPSIRLVQSIIAHSPACPVSLETLVTQLRLENSDTLFLQSLESIAVALDQECSETLARMRGMR